MGSKNPKRFFAQDFFENDPPRCALRLRARLDWMPIVSECFCPACSSKPERTFSDEFRHETEVRYVAAMPSREHRMRYLNGLKRRPQIVEGLQQIAKQPREPQ